MLDYRARWYDPALGRFVSADTIVPNSANPQSLNRYSYVYNNPLKYIDPSGHSPNCLDYDESGTECLLWEETWGTPTGLPWWKQAGDFVAGAFMQYGDDMSMGILSGLANDLDVPYYENGYGSDAYQNGRFAGQIGSTVTGVYLLVDGVWKAVEGAALVGAGGGSEILSGGSSSVVSIPAIGVGGGMIVVGGAEAGYGFGILGNNFSNPVSYAKGTGGGAQGSVNQMNKQIRTGKAPVGVRRVDRGSPALHEQPHVHFDDGSALNVDGTWKHGGTTLTRRQERWLIRHGWTLPGD